MDSRFLVACGFWDNSFRVFSTETGNKACGYAFALNTNKAEYLSLEKRKQKIFSNIIIPIFSKNRTNSVRSLWSCYMFVT